MAEAEPSWTARSGCSGALRRGPRSGGSRRARRAQALAPARSVLRRTDGGSATVELAVVAPVLVVLWLLAATFSTVTTARQRVEEAARAAAQAAAVAPDGGAAATEASAMAATGLGGGRPCAHVGVHTNTSAFVPGGSVTVTITCRLDLGGMAVLGLPPVATVSATTTAPLDRYRAFA